MKNPLLALLVATSLAWAQPGSRGERIGRRLDLTEEQQQQVDKLRSDLQRDQITVRSRIQTLRLDVRDAFRGEKPDRSKIEAKVGEISKLQNEMKLNHLDFWFAVNKILTPEQQRIWKERCGMGGQTRGHRRGGGPMRGRMR